MEVRSMHFKARAAEAAADRALQAKLGTAKGLFVEGRKRAVAEIDLEATREASKVTSAFDSSAKALSRSSRLRRPIRNCSR